MVLVNSSLFLVLLFTTHLNANSMLSIRMIDTKESKKILNCYGGDVL